jgi:peptidoglycan hydrolase CwlO-like protein
MEQITQLQDNIHSLRKEVTEHNESVKELKAIISDRQSK